MRAFSLILASAVALLAVSDAAKNPLSHIRGKFKRVGRTPRDADTVFTLSMPRSNEDMLEKVFYAVSTPGNPEYGKFWSVDKLNALTATKPAIKKHVEAWLARRPGLANCTLTGTGDAFKCRAKAAVVENVFKTKMHRFKHPESGRVIDRVVEKYTFPAGLKGYVDFVSGLNSFPVPHYGRVASLETISARTLARKSIHEKKVTVHQTVTVAEVTATETGSDTGSDPTTHTGTSSGGGTSTTGGTSGGGSTTSGGGGSTTSGGGGSTTSGGGGSTSSGGGSTSPTTHTGTSTPEDDYKPSDDYSPDSSPYVVPETLSDLYSLSGHSGSSSIVQSAVEFQDLGAFESSDLTTFISNTGIGSFSVVKHIGTFDPSEPAAESTLDVQYLGAVGEGNVNWYWTEAQWMYAFTNHALSGSVTLPDVMSMSYGWSEAQQCTISPSSQPCESGGSSAFVKAVNTNFMKIGTAGTTVTAASGDSGAHGRSDPTCESGKVHPAYPAASPYLTAVGATMIVNGTTTGASEPFCTSGDASCYTGGTEVVCSNAQGALITSGGGFSIYAARPSYQDSVVSAYLAKPGVTPGSGNFNSAGRGFPDVAALGHNYYIELQGEEQAVDGTSCACPVFAGVLALLNANRVAGGGSKIGFANPLLYKIAASTPSAFNDITSGNNYCTETECCSTGFEAAVGWDATTGLGTPNLDGLVSGMAAVDKWHAKQVGKAAPKTLKVPKAKTAVRGAKKATKAKKAKAARK